MAKKKRSRKAAKRRQSQVSRRVTAKAVSARHRAKPSQAKKVDFRQEYGYVISDLKHFGILAIAMFATLVILAAVLGQFG